jgi:hypothetical protein
MLLPRENYFLPFSTSNPTSSMEAKLEIEYLDLTILCLLEQKFVARSKTDSSSFSAHVLPRLAQSVQR